MTETMSGTVERCVTYDNGALSDYDGGGPVGIWAFDASKITLWYDESYGNMTNSNRDGAGFDLDGGVTFSVMQNDYSHDNAGAGFLLAQGAGVRAWGRNYVRYNVSQNDGRKNAYGALTLTGGPGPSNAIVENNTFYMSPASGASPSGVRAKWAGTGVFVRNNIFVTTGAIPLASVDSSANFTNFNGNDWWSSGSAFKVVWNGTTYSTLANWQSATGKEMNGSAATGLSVDPKLTAPGAGPTIGDAYKLTSLTQYKLKSGSPMLNAAVALASPFSSYTSATVDFFGQPLTDAAGHQGFEGT